jgi:hypothetical protein
MKLMDKSLKITNSSLSLTIIKSFLVAAYLIAFLTASLMLTGCGSFQLSLDHEDREPTQPVATGITPPSTGTPSEEETQVTLDNPWPSFIGEPFHLIHRRWNCGFHAEPGQYGNSLGL